MKINQIYNEDCLVTMGKMSDSFVDLTVTSPPYDDLRTYKNNVGLKWNFDKFKLIAKELYRVTKQGGVVVWVIADATKKGSETGTSFKQAIYFKECGFCLADTMIYHKTDSSFPRHGHKKYPNAFEYMFILSKGKINSFNLIKDRKNKLAGTMMSGTVRQKDGTMKMSRVNGKKVADFGARTNVWEYSTGKNKSSKDDIAFEHPAIFSEQLANDHIITWSNEGDLIFDPLMGSGTTIKMAKLNNRNYIGSELAEEYCKIAKQRLLITIKS